MPRPLGSQASFGLEEHCNLESAQRPVDLGRLELKLELKLENMLHNRNWGGHSSIQGSFRIKSISLLKISTWNQIRACNLTRQGSGNARG